MKLGDMVDTPDYTQEDVEIQLTQPETLTNLLTTLQNFDLKDLKMTTFPDLRLVIEASAMLAARAQTLHDKRLKRTLQ